MHVVQELGVITRPTLVVIPPKSYLLITYIFNSAWVKVVKSPGIGGKKLCPAVYKDSISVSKLDLFQCTELIC